MTWSSVACPRSSTLAWENNTSMPQARKWVYQFREGSAKMRDLLGGKGAGAAEMTKAGMPVPPGFTITTEACRADYASGGKFPQGLWGPGPAALKGLERHGRKKLGDAKAPPLGSGRSRAKTSRGRGRIPDGLGTAVNVQMMVFGNMGQTSGTGVAFTRNPITGAKELYGDYLANAQGEDVVAGVRDTEPISALKKQMPKVYAQFERYARQLEKHYKDVQDLEFTIERGKLYMLQTRSAKRTGEAAVHIAVDMVKERLITEKDAVARVEPRELEPLLFPLVDPAANVSPLARVVHASPGAASGGAVVDADTPVEWGKQGKAVILVRVETNPNDVHGMVEAKGILTQTGGTASHAALVARGMGRPSPPRAPPPPPPPPPRKVSPNGTQTKE